MDCSIKKWNVNAAICIGFAFSLFGCKSIQTSPAELVLEPGASIEATGNGTTIRVIAGEGIKRRYEWNDCGLDADMWVRPKRWMGGLGMYDAAGRLTINPRGGCNGISRPVVEEGQYHFQNEATANAWLKRYTRSPSFTTVWTHDGLVVHWAINPRRYQISVDVWQICVNGEKPSSLAGANDGAIKITSSRIDGQSRYECAKVSKDVIEETQRAWAENWQQIDKWDAALRSRR